MKNTTFVSAGAGSGKTYRLTQDIARLVTEGKDKCRIEEIILTTYTEPAAKELREKVRSTLYEKGLYEAAMNVDNATIGTIHSIARQLVSRYWYLLDISANATIMDNEGSQVYVSQSLASLPTKENLQLFDDLVKVFNITTLKKNITVADDEFWKKELQDLIDKTIEFCIDEADLEKARVESKHLLKDVLRWNNFDVSNSVINDVVKRLEQIFELQINQPRVKNKEQKRKELYNSIAELKAYNGEIGCVPIYRLNQVISSYATKPVKYIEKEHADDICYFQELVQLIPGSRQVQNLIENYIDTIFDLALEWKKRFEAFKRERCLLDFGDLLKKFEELLNNDEVVEDIQSRYKVAFVDEFQDCSPLQVKSFKRLSELMHQSVWVGDIKQAIYGFRGTNTELIQAVIDEVKQESNGNKLEPLSHCWRSNKTIVDLVNNVFCKKVFKGQIDEKYVRLDMPDRKESDPKAPEERELIHWHFVDGNTKNSPRALVKEVNALIQNNVYKPNEIAILYYGNEEIKGCVNELKKLGIPYNVKIDKKYLDNKSIDEVSSFINAVVSFAANEHNSLSKAIIANRIEQGYNVSKILSDKLMLAETAVGKKDWLNDVDIFNRLAQIKHKIGNQSVSAAIETLIVEMNLSDLIKRIDPSAPAYNYCSELEAKAATYENLRSSFGLSSTLVGFADYLKANSIDYLGDDNGVTVMTYHKSKGLQWPCVILCSLNCEFIKPSNKFFGVLAVNTSNETHLRLVPKALSNICGGIMENFDNNQFFNSLKLSLNNEAKRLMYVGMTRPQEQLILTTYGNNKTTGDNWLTSIGCEPMDSHSDTQTIKWGDVEWNHSVQTYMEDDELATKEADIATFKGLKQPAEHKAYSNKFVSPSKVEPNKELYKVSVCANFAERLNILATDGKDNTIGNFIHHAMCLWNGDKSIIESLATEYGVSADVDCIATSIDNFWQWMEQTYDTPISVERELPFSFINEQGQVVTGEIDLVYHTAEGDVLVDYKTYKGSVSNLTDASNDFYAGKYNGQIALYEDALKRSGRTIRDRLICYISLGVAIRME